jgi:hypothetical protein
MPYEVQGFLGLLSCSAGTASEFVGIILWPAGLDRESPTKIERITNGHPSRHAVLVGPRAAAQAQPSKVTGVILQYNESRTVRNHSFGFRNFIINEFRALLDTGYNISHGLAINVKRISWAFHYGGSWDSTTKV